MTLQRRTAEKAIQMGSELFSTGDRAARTTLHNFTRTLKIAVLERKGKKKEKI